MSNAMSNVASAQLWYIDAMKHLRESLEMGRNFDERDGILAEARLVEEYVELSGRCHYCGEHITVDAVKRKDCCWACELLFERMRDLKTRICSGNNDPALVRQLLHLYKEFNGNVPYVLRGSTGNVVDVIKALELASVAELNLSHEQRLAASTYDLEVCSAVREALHRYYPALSSKS